MAYVSQHKQTTSTPLRIIGIVAGILIALIVIAYAAGCIFFSNHLWLHTTVNGVDISLATRAEATEALEELSSERSVKVSGQGIDFTLTSESSGIGLDVDAAVNALFDEITPWAWLGNLIDEHDESNVVTTSFDRARVGEVVTAAINTFNETAYDPIDAWVGYDDEYGCFTVFPGSIGTKLDPDAVVNEVINALQSEQNTVELTVDQLVPQAHTASDPVLIQASEDANWFLTCNLDLTLNGITVANLNGSIVKDWVIISDDYSVYINNDSLVSWVDWVESLVDSVGTTRTYTRPNGKVITVRGGTYGWISNGNAIEEIVWDALYSGTVGSEVIPCKQYAVNYNPGGKDWGSRYIDVDLTQQHVYFYDWDGSLIWESDCISGATDGEHETPTGVYMVTNKAMNQILIGANDPLTGEPEYETPVTYWMPFIGNSVGLHDATWQPAFGGSMNSQGYGSHGCINLPYSKAQTLYSLINIGDVVITHY